MFGIGLSRTGTTSLTVALEILGHRAVHFPSDRRSRREIGAYLDAPVDALRLTLLERCDALTDTPVSVTYRGLDRAYPGSRFVMTVRERTEWLASCSAYWERVLHPLLQSVPPALRAYIRRINRAVYGTEDFDAGRFAAAYDRHLAVAREHFRGRPGDYLELDVCGGEGWRRLCAFLEVDTPPDPFPALNARPPADARIGDDGVVVEGARAGRAAR